MDSGDAESLYRFYVLVAAQAHESWFAFLPNDLQRAARRSRLGVQILSRMLAHREGLATPDRFELDSENRWVLEDAPALTQAAVRLGAFALAPMIATCIQRDRVRAVRSVIGEDGHRAALASVENPLGCLPEGEAESWNGSDEFRALAERTGFRLMRATLPADDASVARRVALKFPRSYANLKGPGAADVPRIRTLISNTLAG